MHRKMMIFLVFVVICLAAGSVILAAPGSPVGGLSIPWWTVDGGGDTSYGGEFALSGTAGQPDAGPMTGGSYSLSGGYWNSAVSPDYKVYLPTITR